MKRKILLYGLIGVVAMIGCLAGVWYWIGQAGTSPLERWIGRQLMSLANAYLNPQMDFDDLDYQAPYTVVLTNFRLTADDPDQPGQKFDMIRVERLQLELAEIPREGQPVRIKALILNRPIIRAVAARCDGTFIGFENLLKEPEEVTAGKPAEAPRLSDVFQIVLLEIIDGQVVYESRGGGSPPLILDAINSRLDVEKDAQGWYKLAARADREPVFRATVAGRLDLDHLLLDIETLQMEIELGEKQYRSLPGQLQQLLAQHEITGMLTFAASGRLPLADPSAGDLIGAMAMERMHFVAGEYQGEAANVGARLRLKEGQAVLEALDAKTLKGTVHLVGEVAATAPFEGQFQLVAKDIQIEELLRGTSRDAEPKYRGIVSAEITLTGPMNAIRTRAGGAGWLRLREGKLGRLPMMAEIGKALARQIASIFAGKAEASPPTDSADLEFRFLGDRVHFTRILVQNPTFAITGHGDLWFDRRLKLLLNAGPIEKLQLALGGDVHGGNEVVDVVGTVLNTVGRGAADLTAEVLSQLGTVVVEGTTDEPQIRIEPFRRIRDTLE